MNLPAETDLQQNLQKLYLVLGVLRAPLYLDK